MFKSKQIISFLFLNFYISSVLLNAVFADDPLPGSTSSRAKSIDNFKETQYNYIFSNDDNLLLKDDGVNFFDTSDKEQFYEKLKTQLSQKTQDLTLKSNVASLRVDNLQEALKELDDEIQTITEQILTINNNIDNLNQKVEDTKKQLEDLQNQIIENKKVLLDYISHIYKKSNALSDGKDIDGLKTIIMNSDDLGDVLNDIHFTTILEVAGQGLIEKHRNLMKQLFLTKIDLENTTKKLKSDKEQVITDRKTIMEKRNYREEILNYTKGEQELYEQFLAQNEEVDKNLKLKILQTQFKLKVQKETLLKKYNCKSIDQNALDQVSDIYLDDGTDTGSTSKISNEQQCINLNKIIENETLLRQSTNSGVTSTGTNLLNWPIDPSKGLSAYYHDPEYQDVVGTSHDAIDIRTAQGTEIKAPADGYVTYLRNPVDKGYAYVVLKHANGLITVYGHVNEILVKQYDYVKAGEVFAKSGGEPGTNGAGPMTTGPHLHMEVFKDKQNVDPLDYLDLTVLGEDNIPAEQKYVYKYIQDYKAINGDEYTGSLSQKVKVFSLSGETEVDRQKDLLNKYATKDFNNWDMWVEESIDGNIDPSFLMCIGLAETSLGRSLKSGYNVGNVGNTDSGDTQTFGSPRNGIYWMVKTLNNKFLGKYDDMSMLSRYGNKTGSIYASSDFNWHNNIKKCLSALKQTNVPDNYNFRIGN